MDFFDFSGRHSFNKNDINVGFKSRRISKPPHPVSAVNSGGAMLITIFVALCLTVFGFLAFSTSFSDRKLTDKNIKNQVEFYSADSQAELRIAEIYETLYTAGIQDMNELAVKVGALDFIAEESVFYDPALDAISIDFITDQNSYHAIYTSVYFYIGQNGKWEYKINGWYTFLTKELDYNQSYDVWNGE